MIIECYEIGCKFHGYYHGEEGPYCNEDECKIYCKICGKPILVNGECGITHKD